MNWWQRLRNCDRLDGRADVKLRYHFDRQVEDNIRMGMSEEEARRRARLDLGGDDQLKESCRDARGTRWVHDVWQDFRCAARLLSKDRWFTLPGAIALAHVALILIVLSYGNVAPVGTGERTWPR